MKMPNAPFLPTTSDKKSQAFVITDTEPILSYSKSRQAFVISESLALMSLLNSQSQGLM